MNTSEIIRLHPQFYLCKASDVLNHGIIAPYLFCKIVSGIMRECKIKPMGIPTIAENPDDEIFGYYRRTTRGGFVSAEIIPRYLLVQFNVFSAIPFNPEKFRQKVAQHLQTEAVTISLTQFPKLATPQRSKILYFPERKPSGND